MKTRYSLLPDELSNGPADGVAMMPPNSPLDTKTLLTPPRSIFGRAVARPNRPQLKIVILGPTLTASVGNGSASTYRGLVRELAVRGHEVLYLERAEETAGRNMRNVESGRVEEYFSQKELKDRHAATLSEADFILIASQIAEVAEIGEWVTREAQGVTAFYDLDTPGRLANLGREGADSISAELISRFDLYLSFVGGSLMDQLEDRLGTAMARPLFSSVDARLFFPEHTRHCWDLGYLGRHTEDSQPVLERLLLEPARRWAEGRFVVAGSRYPRSLCWPGNVQRLAQLPPHKRRNFYNSQRFTLNVTSPELIGIGYSPSARLFEAAACGTPLITEFWPGLDTFFTPDEEILISHSPDETLIYLEEISEVDRRRLAYRARERVLARHTSRHRAAELEGYVLELMRPSAA